MTARFSTLISRYADVDANISRFIREVFKRRHGQPEGGSSRYMTMLLVVPH